MRNLLGVLCLLSLPLLAHAQTSDAPSGTTRVPLQFKPDAFSSEDYEEAADQDFAFKKEPHYQGRQVIRGAFPCGTAYAIDVKGKKLYIDANGSMDLTDDPRDVYDSDNEFMLEFKNVRLPRKKGPGQEPVVMDLDFLGNGSFFHTFKSGWSGTVQLGGKEFSITLPDSFAQEDFGRSMRINPADQKEPIASPVGPKGFLAIADHVYAVSVDTANSTVEAVFREITENTGEVGVDAYLVEVTQGAIEYEENNETRSVIFPEKKSRLPFGQYGVSQIFLKNDNALFNLAPIYPAPPFQVKAAPTTLNLGPPLRETVTAKRVSNRLQFAYRLEGKGHEEYCLVQDTEELPFRQADNAPMLTVKQGDRVLLSDKFNMEYG